MMHLIRISIPNACISCRPRAILRNSTHDLKITARRNRLKTIIFYAKGHNQKASPLLCRDARETLSSTGCRLIRNCQCHRLGVDRETFGVCDCTAVFIPITIRQRRDSKRRVRRIHRARCSPLAIRLPIVPLVCQSLALGAH